LLFVTLEYGALVTDNSAAANLEKGPYFMVEQLASTFLLKTHV